MRREWVTSFSRFRNRVGWIFALNLSDILLTIWQVHLKGIEIEANGFMVYLFNSLGVWGALGVHVINLLIYNGYIH